ncbi:MAG: methyltransferase [Proteobacteria bacterium]|nr:methyltransferase [Pseudomonadota bacterium]
MTVFSSVQALVDILKQVESRDSGVLAAYPELAGMLDISSAQEAVLSIEHPVGDINPAWAHLKVSICEKLAGIAQNDASLFQSEQVLGMAGFSALVAKYKEISAIPWLAECFHAALLFSDISKGAAFQRTAALKDIDFSLHNEASAKILRQLGTLRRLGLDALGEATSLALVHSHGMIGQFVRGEITYHAFAPWREFLQENADRIAQQYVSGDTERAIALLTTAYFLLNVVDTAGVREGLMTNALYERFGSVTPDVMSGARISFESEVSRWLADVFGKGMRSERWCRNIPLAVRIGHLREGRRRVGESERAVTDVIASMTAEEFAWFAQRMQKCQLWYCEAASGDLSASAQMKLIAIGMHLWENSVSFSPDCIFHVDMSPIASLLSPFAPAPTRDLAVSRSNYRKRLMEAILANQSFAAIMDGSAAIYSSDILFGVEGRRGGQFSVSLEIREAEEATALITLLSIYERKSSVSYHSALKLLCDLYHLRKDDFDRLANEAQYLLTMNAARSDKARMLRWLHSGSLVEIGPGGGVVLDLLEQHFPDAKITGLDCSHQVVVALEQKKCAQNASWRIIEGNAFELPKYFAAETLDGVIFCSILHEIYSYVERADGTRFHLESVRDMLRSAFEVIRPGGRILIRDGIMPPHEPRLLRFCCEDAKDFFEAFCREFKGRNIAFEYVGPDTVSLDSADAMEFMYTYTWGPESFPYEVREQYGIMTYRDYCDRLREWLGPRAQILPVPPEEAQYLQPGYVKALQHRVHLMDAQGNPVDFPASNAIIVIEKQ